MTVYADVLFLVNLSLNWFSLLLTSKISKHAARTKKLLLSASIGALLGTVTLFFENSTVSALIEIASSFLMCAIAFKASSILDYVRLCTCLFASGITLGGSLTFIYSTFNRAGIELPRGNDISAAVFLFMSLMVTIGVTLFERLLYTKREADGGEVSFLFGGKTVTLPFMCDSGNLLRDPISGRPAIIVSAAELRGFLPDGVLDFDPLYPDGIGFAVHGVRILPAATVCGEGLMTGFVPDSTLVRERGREKEVDAVIALDKRGKNFAYAGAKAIVPRSLLH